VDKRLNSKHMERLKADRRVPCSGSDSTFKHISFQQHAPLAPRASLPQSPAGYHVFTPSFHGAFTLPDFSPLKLSERDSRVSRGFTLSAISFLCGSATHRDRIRACRNYGRPSPFHADASPVGTGFKDSAGNTTPRATGTHGSGTGKEHPGKPLAGQAKEPCGNQAASVKITRGTPGSNPGHPHPFFSSLLPFASPAGRQAFF
jgi:hypothetical protein